MSDPADMDTTDLLKEFLRLHDYHEEGVISGIGLSRLNALEYEINERIPKRPVRDR